MTTWIYKQTEGGWARDDGTWCRGLWTVGHGEGDSWFPESDHDSPEEAAARVHWLNGGTDSCDCAQRLAEHTEQIEALIATTTTHTELLDTDGERLDEHADSIVALQERTPR